MFRSRHSVVTALLFAAALVPAYAGTVRFTATINATQETSGSTSTATGSAVLLYDVTANRFDLVLTINGFSNTITASHIHEGATGVAGAVVTNLGAEVVYTRSGNTLTATFLDITHGGTAATLIAGNAYLNFHSAAFPNGEVRGQLIPDPVRLTTIMRGSNEAPTPNSSTAYGATQATYNPATNKIDVLICVYNYTNTLTASHIHDGGLTVAGPVVTNFGAAAAYTKSGNTYVQLFSGLTHGGNPVLLLSEGSYTNVHSNVFPGGEIRGQLSVVDPTNFGRLTNVSARGQVGTGDNVLITGLSVAGTQPVRALLTARGPILTSFGVAGVLANPQLSIADSAGRTLFSNDDLAGATFSSLITASGFAPSNANESAVLLLLPPGTYTGVVSGVSNSTGVALAEAFEVSW